MGVAQPKSNTAKNGPCFLYKKKVNEDVLNKVLEAKENRKEIILATQLENGNQLFLDDKKEDSLSLNLKQIAYLPKSCSFN